MKFEGISRTFSTEGNQQYATIGAFWEEMSKIYGVEKLRGLGYNWTENSIEYVIGLKEGIIDGANCSVVLPDTGWSTEKGNTADLGKMDGRIYNDGPLLYEIEMFTSSGSFEVLYYRN